MNIDFNKIAEFCATKNQKKKIAILQKKFSFNNSKSREVLTDLISSLFVNKIYEPFKIIIPAILQVKFEEDFKIWENRKLPALKNNPNITKIVIIDPKTKISTVIFQR